jgi:cytochrome c-type biogenesis protein CcmH/NrfF
VKRRYDALQRFFLCYVYPDAHLDADSQLRVASDLLGTGDEILLDQVINDLRELIQEPASDQQLHETIYEEYSQFYDPSHNNITMRIWLVGLLEELQRKRAS